MPERALKSKITPASNGDPYKIAGIIIKTVKSAKV